MLIAKDILRHILYGVISNLSKFISNFLDDLQNLEMFTSPQDLKFVQVKSQDVSNHEE